MQKQVWIFFSVLLISGCTSSSDSTLLTLFGSDGNKSPTSYVAGEAAAEASTVPSGSSYYLAKRGDRYAAADHVITPGDYSIVASRTVNKMLSDAPAIFAADKQAPLYIAEMVQIDRYLPEGSYAAEKSAKDILYGSNMFNIVTDQSKADYVLQSSITNANTPEVPVVVYRMELYDATGKILGAWSDSIRQVQNDDKSWW